MSIQYTVRYVCHTHICTHYLNKPQINHSDSGKNTAYVYCKVFSTILHTYSSLQLQYIFYSLFSFASNYNLIIRKYLQYKYLIYSQGIFPTDSAPAESARLRNAYESLLIEEPVFVHPSSTLAPSALRARSRSSDAAPEFLLFMELNETSKVYMRSVFINSDYSFQHLAR